MALNQGFAYQEQIDGLWGNLSVLTYLSERHRHSSLEEWKTRLEKGEISLNGLPLRSDTVLKGGQRLVWHRPPWNEPDVPVGYGVLHRDEDLLAVAKPSGLPTMPGGGFLERTLLFQVRKTHPNASPVHRLGRGTSGVVLFALTPRAKSTLSLAFRQKNVVKVYRALVLGAPKTDNFSIEVPIGPVPHPILGTIHAACTGGKQALSLVKVLEHRKDASLVQVVIETGRPHQIRIHLAAAGHPLVGDPLYARGGGIREHGGALPGDCGYFLHAEALQTCHPATGFPFKVGCHPPAELRIQNNP